jgi:hypothetical protein
MRLRTDEKGECEEKKKKLKQQAKEKRARKIYVERKKRWKSKGEMRISVCSVCIPNFFV